MSQLFACASAAVAHDRRRRHGDRSQYLFQSIFRYEQCWGMRMLCYFRVIFNSPVAEPCCSDLVRRAFLAASIRRPGRSLDESRVGGPFPNRGFHIHGDDAPAGYPSGRGVATSS